MARTMNASQAKNTNSKRHIHVLIGANKVPSRREDLRSVRFNPFPLRLSRTLIPASAAKIRVALQVVPPSLFSATAAPISLLESFTGSFLRSASRSSSCGASPILTRPSMRPMVAGILPDVLTFRSTDLAVSRLTGYGMPWVMMVDSKATTGFRAFSASATSEWMSMRALLLRAVANEEKPRFEARVSMALAELLRVWSPSRGQAQPIAWRQLSTLDVCG